MNLTSEGKDKVVLSKSKFVKGISLKLIKSKVDYNRTFYSAKMADRKVLSNLLAESAQNRKVYVTTQVLFLKQKTRITYSISVLST